MAKALSTVWDLEPHTQAKHEILKRYLQAWVPILSRGGFPKVLYVDGFAGPGIYKGDEVGSPIIALTAARDQAGEIATQATFLFIEDDAKRIEVLREQVAKLAPSLPVNFRIDIQHDKFETAFGRVLERYRTSGQRLPPTFAFIDPFGWTGAPFDMVTEIMSNRSCEVLITFMYEEINRFIGFADQERNFGRLFGCEDWRDGVTLTNPNQRDQFLRELYIRQLRDVAKVKYVRSFQIRNRRNSVDYYLVFGTNNLTGLARMKDAMWGVDPRGEFSFSDATDENQLVLFENEPNLAMLRRQITDRFTGREVARREIEEYVLAETAFRNTHYKVQILKPMEREGALKVLAAQPGRKAGTFRDPEMRIKFE